jgi:rhodanese-related sulfurtransferase
MDIKIYVIVGLVLLVGYTLSKSGGDVKGPDARKMVAEGALLLDVRTTGEFAGGALPGAINIPVQDLEARMKEVGAKDRPIVVYCRSGQRSGRAARMLKAAGYQTVQNLGSISSW